jgi:hypothetical protein
MPMAVQTDHLGLIDFIRRRGGIVTARQITQSYWPLKNQRERAETILSQLVGSGGARWEEVKTTAKGGRPTRKIRLLPRVIPVVHPPNERPQPYSWWTPEDRQRFGIASPRTQWQLLQRMGKGISIEQAADDMGLPLADVKKFISRNPRFRARITRVRGWSLTRRLARS